MKQTASICK